ncbi:hypothetical protein LZ554_000516 [Drepanopeziza brunnea f. sp. 'monogermtubi']|nr:hypothetical protein LZ554_000516 [Drepanopeziza brunnea f. sp. 'monogermtubi']
MPGILPMKVIKVGSNSLSRIAQACDRCRSKKIRCDGIRPCCSQCANVGFECKTSDKLSRRAFPRGYTESLEERVRVLEGEVRELKDLLDEKDEKIDMLSRMHSNRRSSVSGWPAFERRDFVAMPPKDGVFRVQESPLLPEAGHTDSYFMGASSGRAFVDAFKRRVQESGKSLAGLNTETFLNVEKESTMTASPTTGSKTPNAPPRMFSDRCVNVYFQEWAPLFPVLHKPTFLRLYEEYMSNPEQVTDPHKLAQLHLVLCIAGISSDVPDEENIALCENKWRESLESILMDSTLVTLQCLILALMCCISKADYTRLQHYKGIAIGLSHRLGLHQSQKRFSFGALTIESRKRVFWTLYTVDCFSAASLGLPKMFKEEDIHAEYPTDTDDEYVTEKGFQPTLPGEPTKISSALALFRVSRILSKVLDQNYPAAANHDLSLQSLASLEGELTQWFDQLPVHLKLTFVQDKPSADVTGSRSALLALAYYHIRSLIHRPAVSSTLGNKSSPSVISLADSSKHIIQIVQLLVERNMSFSFCLNKNETLTICGLGILYQGLDLKQEGKLMKYSQRLVATVVQLLEKANAPGAVDFKRLSFSIIPEVPAIGLSDRSPNEMGVPTSSESTPSPMVARQQPRPQVHRHSSATMSERDPLSHQDKLRYATAPSIKPDQENLSRSRSSLDSGRSESPTSKHRCRYSVAQLPFSLESRPHKNEKLPNLDYLSLSNTPVASQSPVQLRSQLLKTSGHTPILTSTGFAVKKQSSGVSPSEWEALLGSLDGGQTNLYDAIYGGPAPVFDNPSSNYGNWAADWDITTLTMGDFGNTAPEPASSVLSFSEESLSSGEDLSTSESVSLGGKQEYGVQMIGGGDHYLLEGLEAAFGL